MARPVRFMTPGAYLIRENPFLDRRENVHSTRQMYVFSTSAMSWTPLPIGSVHPVSVSYSVRVEICADVMLDTNGCYNNPCDEHRLEIGIRANGDVRNIIGLSACGPAHDMVYENVTININHTINVVDLVARSHSGSTWTIQNAILTVTDHQQSSVDLSVDEWLQHHTNTIYAGLGVGSKYINPHLPLPTNVNGYHIEPENNDGRHECFFCGDKLRVIAEGTLRVCEECDRGRRQEFDNED